MVDVAEVSEKVENIADAGASSLIEVFYHRFICLCILSCQCMHFFPMMKLSANMSILSYISEILN